MRVRCGALVACARVEIQFETPNEAQSAVRHGALSEVLNDWVPTGVAPSAELIHVEVLAGAVPLID